MNIVKRWSIIIFSAFFTFLSAPPAPQSLNSSVDTLILDTCQQDPYLYEEPLGRLAQSTGLTLHYHPVSSAIDTPDEFFSPDRFKIALFILDATFIKGLETSPISEKIASLIKKFAQKPNTVTGLIFKSNVFPSDTIMKSLKPLFGDIGMSFDDASLNQFFATLITWLKLPPERRRVDYHTTLRAPGKGLSFTQSITKTLGQKRMADLKKTSVQQAAFLPHNYSAPQPLLELMPFGFYQFNKKYGNHLIIGNNSFLTGLSVTENYQFCPVDQTLRSEYEKGLQEMLWQLRLLATQQKVIAGIDLPRIIASPAPLHTPQLKPMPTSTNKLLPQKTAWMEITPFEEQSTLTNEQLQKKRLCQQQLIDYVLTARLDGLWISFAPNMYYSPHGKAIKNLPLFWQSINRFTKKLRSEAMKRNQEIPGIHAGIEVSNNFTQKEVLPQTSAVTLYGTNYKKCPAPLLKTFWKDEVIIPMKKFVRDWQQHANRVPLRGMILDLEMYFSPPGKFTGIMGFDVPSIKQFDVTATTSDVFIKNLLKKGTASAYFASLKNRAEKIGQFIKTECRKAIPHCLFGCYVDKISPNWFYQGLFQGLSSIDKPLLLLSFNNEFEMHRGFLEKKKIAAEHASVLMLSKLQKRSDIKPWAAIAKAGHHGIWLNRFSRLVEDYKAKNWTTPENTPFSDEDKQQLVNHLGKD